MPLHDRKTLHCQFRLSHVRDCGLHHMTHRVALCCSPHRMVAEVRAHRLREVREEQGLTQVELAARMHVTQPSISELERGELDRAGLATIKAYVEALGGSVEVVADSGDHRMVIG